MFRFTIRELVLLTLVVAMGVGWWIEHRAMQSRHAANPDELENRWRFHRKRWRSGTGTIQSGNIRAAKPALDALR
jgi:hypothetical protein